MATFTRLFNIVEKVAFLLDEERGLGHKKQSGRFPESVLRKYCLVFVTSTPVKDLLPIIEMYHNCSYLAEKPGRIIAFLVTLVEGGIFSPKSVLVTYVPFGSNCRLVWRRTCADSAKNLQIEQPANGGEKEFFITRTDWSRHYTGHKTMVSWGTPYLPGFPNAQFSTDCCSVSQENPPFFHDAE